MAASRFILGALLAFFAACGGQSNRYAYSEPIRVRGAQFVTGELPGTPPVAPPPVMEMAPPQPRTVTGIVTLNPNVYLGEANKQISGRASGDSASIALRFDDIGTGYWVLPVGAPDPLFPGELTWSASSDFNPNALPGMHPLRVVAIDGNGRAGVQSEQRFCLASKVPDNLNACHPQTPAPEAVFTLSWDANVDLDLHVVAPGGREVDPKHPLVYAVDAGQQPASTNPAINHDSMVGCAPDGRRQEDLVFPARPKGTWLIYVNLFDACRAGAVSFTVQVSEPEGTGENRHLVETFRQSGRLVAVDANGGSAPGSFVVEYPFN